jgi:hypothetical protein
MSALHCRRQGRVRVAAMLADRLPEAMVALRRAMVVRYEEDRDGFIDLVGYSDVFDCVSGFIPPYEAAFRCSPAGEMVVTLRRIG